MAGDEARASRTRKYIIGGLLAAAAVAVALALIFTVGKAAQKSKETPTSNNVKSLNDGTAVSKSGSGGTASIPSTTTTTTTVIPPISTINKASDVPAINTPDVAPVAEMTPDVVMKPSASGDEFLASIVKGSAISSKSEDGTSCTAANADDLRDMVENQKCETVFLNSREDGAYAITDSPIQVTRRVTVMGHPAIIPIIDGSGTVRSFKVKEGGFLELKFVRVKQGGGVMRKRGTIFSPERRLQDGTDAPAADATADSPPPYTQVAEIRGGAVAFEPGALGGNFVGVIFLAVANTLQSVQTALESTENFVGSRVYGGHIFMAAGVVTFFNCHFWDTVILLPFTDQLTLGGDVLVLAGTAIFTACTWTATTLFGNWGMVGGNVAVFGGALFVTFSTLQAQSIAVNTAGAGICFTVVGGFMVMTAFDFRFVTGVFAFEGIGDFFVGGGVMILTGVTIENAYGAFVAAGAGFYLATGLGVLIQTGVTYVQYNGPNWQAMTGAVSFLGLGTNQNIGVPMVFGQTVGSYFGQATIGYNGGGYMGWVGCPQAVFGAIFAFFGLGGNFSLPMGFMLYVGNPLFVPVAIGAFFGLGVVVFTGAGGLYVVASPVSAPAAVSLTLPAAPNGNYWVFGQVLAADGGESAFGPSRRLGDGSSGSSVVEQNVLGNWAGKVNETRLRQYADSLNGGFTQYFNDTPSANASDFTYLLGRDVHSTKHAPDYNSSAWDWVPEGARKAGGLLMDESVTKLGLQGADVVDLPSFAVHANSSVNCHLCNVDSVSGDVCHVEQSCEAMEVTRQIPGVGDLKFKPYYIFESDSKVSSENGTSVNASDVAGAWKEILHSEGIQNIMVTSYKKDVIPPELSAFLQKPASTRHLSETHSVSNDFGTMFVATSLTDLGKVQDLFSTDRVSDISSKLMSVLGVDYGANSLGKAALSALDSITSVPAYDSAALKADDSMTREAMGSNGIRVVENGAEANAITSLTKGKEYELVLNNFKPNTAYTVQAISTDALGNQLVHNLPTITVDSKGNGKLSFIAPSDLGSSVYFKAADETGKSFGLSNAMPTLLARRKRKLYGPIMYM